MFDKKSRKLVRKYTLTVGKAFGKFLTPNQMTMITLLFGVITAELIYVKFFILAAITLLLSGVTDWLDGAIAKAMKKATKFGGVWDSVVDKLTELMVYIALVVVYPWLAIPSFLAATMMMWSSYVNQCCKSAGLEKGVGLLQRKERIFLLLVLLVVLELVKGTLSQPLFLQLPGNSMGLLISSFILYVIASFSFITGMQRLYLTYKKVK